MSVGLKLIGGTRPELGQNVVNAAIEGLGVLKRRRYGALHRYRTFASKEPYYFTQLKRIALWRGTVAQSALRLFDVDVDEVLLKRAESIEGVLAPTGQFL